MKLLSIFLFLFFIIWLQRHTYIKIKMIILYLYANMPTKYIRGSMHLYVKKKIVSSLIQQNYKFF